MTNFGQARAHMVDNQLRTSGVNDWRILNLMGAIAREDFVAASRKSTAYVDDVQWLDGAAPGRFIAPPATFAKLLQLADIAADETVLDIGAGTGYSTAIIAGLARSVVGYEADTALAEAARQNLATLGVSNASIIARLSNAQFDVVFVEGTLGAIPPEFFAAMKDGGRLIALVQTGGVGVAHVFVKTGTTVTSRIEFNASLPPLLTTRAVEEFVF